MSVIQQILIAVSLCADCFAVSLCSSVTIRQVTWKQTAGVAFAFAVIQSALLLAGWLFGNLFVGLVDRISHIIGFLLLLYVGGGMLAEGIRDRSEARELNGLRNVVIGGIATSIDALAVGVSRSMDRQDAAGFFVLFAAVFAVTFLSVVTGIWGGKTIGRRAGRWAEIVGGVVLIGVGVGVLL